MIHDEIKEGESLTDGNETISTDGSSNSSWMLDDATPGSGDRPDWLPEKFKSAADLGKSYRELEKMRTSQAPDEYDFSKAKHIDSNFESFEGLKKVAKDNRVSQDVMDAFVTSVDGYLGQFEVNEASEMEKLGPDAKERMTVLDNWVESRLSESDSQALFSQVRTAEAITAIENLRKSVMDNQTTVPSGNTDADTSSETIEDIQSEINSNYEKYKTDPKYQREIQHKLSRFAKDSNLVDKLGN